ncbi:PGAP2-interacting protein-like [Haliotis cracherodii]|uniref:PGAP2-interacting protein-like n=1 Tax=Haliotis cracherodii TaxID=6455 RepID=UPI0039EC7B62
MAEASWRKKTSGKDERAKMGDVQTTSAKTLIRDTINGFVFWSLFQALAPMIWFYPLNELEISGYEAFAAVWFCPIFCILPGFLCLIQNRWVLGLLRLVCVGCLASFQMPTTLSRLVTLAVGSGTATLVMAALLFSPSTRIRSQFYWSLMLGMFAFLSSRIWLTSFVPTWWSNSTNTAVISLGAIAALDQIMSGDDRIEDGSKRLSKAERPYWIPASLGFGSLLYVTHACFGEVSLILRWVVKGYPDHGPMPYPWGGLVLLSLAFGAYMSQCHHVSNTTWWWVCGLLGFFAMYFLPRWMGFGGGLVLAVYVMSVWPKLFDQMSGCPATSLTLAMVVYVAEVLFGVWTVAYNFVPGGVYTREHTDWLIGFVMVMILFGLYSRGKITESRAAFVTINKTKMPSTSHSILLFLLVMAGLGGLGARYNPRQYDHAPKTAPHEFTAAIWTYHFGYDNKGWPSLERGAQLLSDTGADFITLLESDASKPFLGNNDLGMWLGERLGMYVDFGVSTKDHTWGNLILSKYPIVKSTHHLLPSPHGELAPAITATVNYTGKLVDFVVTHMGNDRDVLDRELQAKFLSTELRNAENPAVFLGYVTSQPRSRDYYQLINHGKVKDIDETDQDRWCEYIMYKGLIRLGYARITHGGLSDTEVQVARFRIPGDPQKYSDHAKTSSDGKKVEERIRFNSKFGSYHVGHGYFNGHGFHMSTPKYFLP